MSEVGVPVYFEAEVVPGVDHFCIFNQPTSAKGVEVKVKVKYTMG